MLTVEQNKTLAEEVSLCYSDPLRFVLAMYPWGMPGDALEKYSGPDDWQTEFLNDFGEEIRKRNFNGRDPVEPIRMTISKGHGVGGTTIAAWIVNFIMSSRPNAIGSVSANTYKQLNTKTWAAIKRWTGMCLTRHWFKVTDDKIVSLVRPDAWYCSAQSSKETNSEAFQGQHAADSTSFYILDEACHDAATDVMSKRGWIRFAEIAPDDELLTPNGWERAIAVHGSRYSGPMLQSTVRGLSLSITPSHELWGDSQKGVRKKVKARDVTTLLCPRTVEWSAPDRAVTDDELRLLAWFCSEGHLIRNNYKYKSNYRKVGRPRSNRGFEFLGFGITCNKDHGISSLLDHLQLSWIKSDNHWLVYDKHRAQQFAQLGVGCLNRTLPAWLFSLSQRQIRVFLETYALGDGYRNKHRIIIYTSSVMMADALHALAVLAGYNSSLIRRNLKGKTSWIKDHWATSSVDGSVISLSETGARVELDQRNLKPIPYSGMVYCATVPSGILLTRREGTVIWSGNSAIPDKIFEVSEGGLTDGEPMMFAFGNCTRLKGSFYRINFGSEQKRWNHRTVDSRRAAMSNKPLIEEWINDRGLDSDFVRVRVLGLPPRAGDSQFIDLERIEKAQKRRPVVLDDEPLVCGVDFAWGGADDNVVRFRRGADARSIPPIRIPGEMTRDPAVMTSKLSDVLSRQYDVAGKKVKLAMMFLDSAGIAGPVGARLRTLGYQNVVDVNFGAHSPDIKYVMMRDFMWGEMKEWLLTGAIEDDPFGSESELKTDLMSPGVIPDKMQRVKLESKDDMKARGEDSPDDADALCLQKNTLIKCIHGDVPIEEVRVGDVVVTPFGNSPVMRCFESYTEKMTTARFSNGANLSGKPDHKLFTFSRGKVRLDALQLTDSLSTSSQWERFLWRIVSMSFIGARSTGFKQAVDTLAVGSASRIDFFTAGCGLTIAGLYQNALRFITATAIGETTPFRTLRYALSENISANTCWQSRETQRLERNGSLGSLPVEMPPRSGTAQRQGLNGTENMPRGSGRKQSRSQKTVPCAVSFTERIWRIASTALLHAGKKLGSKITTRTSGTALGAVRSSWRTVTGRQPVVPVSVRTENVQPTKTYNLTLREHNAYYANGILVFNCLTFSHKVAPRKPEAVRSAVKRPFG